MREEAEKGRKPAQAAKEGFEHALSAIIDSNVTTFMTAAVLKYVGTGPVRGFATTLMIGIATTVFAVVVITRLLVDLQVKKGVQGWKMSRWLADADFDFLKYGKAAAIGSTLAIVIGLGVFISAPASQKYGIDFLGGARVKVRTEEPRSVDEVRTLVARIPGEIGTTAEVIALPISQDGAGYREFAISFKTPPGAESDTADHFAREIRTALAEIIQRGPIEVSLDQGPEPRAHLVLYFETPHSTADLEQALAGVSLAELTVQNRAGQENVFEVGGVPQGLDETRLAGQVQSALAGQRDQSGREYALAEPMPEASVIGAQVVGELRDSAIRAILISVFLIVMYIRVRFAEYSYGFAAVAAVVHDVLIALGAIAVMVHLPFIEVEMNLTMIAAFLTILGYSLNDTIVIFDRVRENLPRVKGTFAEVVNLSINQTISRTITTSTTALFSVITMLAFNLGTGNVLEGFMLALLVGFISGVYSTIYIACPLLIWLEKRSHKRPGASEAVLSSEKAPAAT
jgi:SecD/SecF fusion protein